MTKIEFDDEGSRLVEAFNASSGATARRRRIMAAMELSAGDRVLDVGSGPGHQVLEMSAVVGDTGLVAGVDSAESALEISRSRCSDLTNVSFQIGEAAQLPFEDATFDVAMSSQVFEYLDDVPVALAEIFRVLRPGGRALAHGTDWGTLLWHSSDADRMRRMLTVWDGHLADPHLPQTLAAKLFDAGFQNVGVKAHVQIDTEYDPKTVGGLLAQFVAGYALSQGVSEDEVNAWIGDLGTLASAGASFCSWTEYIFTANRR